MVFASWRKPYTARTLRYGVVSATPGLQSPTLNASSCPRKATWLNWDLGRGLTRPTGSGQLWPKRCPPLSREIGGGEVESFGSCCTDQPNARRTPAPRRVSGVLHEAALSGSWISHRCSQQRKLSFSTVSERAGQNQVLANIN